MQFASGSIASSTPDRGFIGSACQCSNCRPGVWIIRISPAFDTP
ncbi:MAG: hypothetical protein WBN04_10025 [Paracoccaceae bacterium]